MTYIDDVFLLREGFYQPNLKECDGCSKTFEDLVTVIETDCESYEYTYEFCRACLYNYYQDTCADCHDLGQVCAYHLGAI